MYYDKTREIYAAAPLYRWMVGIKVESPRQLRVLLEHLKIDNLGYIHVDNKPSKEQIQQLLKEYPLITGHIEE